MTDDRDDTNRAAIRARFAAALNRVNAVPPSDWRQSRDDEARTVQQVAAARRRAAA